MGFKDLLAIIESAEDAEAMSGYAHSLADAFQAHLTVAGVTPQMPPAPAFMGEFPYELVQQAQEKAMEQIAAGYAKFEKAASRPNTSDLVRIESPSGAIEEATARLARQFDLSLVLQPTPERRDASLIESVLFNSGRPLLILPYIQHGPARLGKIIVAWDGGAAAARSLGAAMPALKRAGRVEVVTMVDPRKSAGSLPGVDITRHLARHGVHAELKNLPKGDDVGALLLSYAADENADMLVMGGYGHSRFRELVLGGATRTILQSMTLPIFMKH
ncbi:MAG: universal stress protein [Hyphomicrobiales bacterium]|nr:universal stress protein [Hyphomicrobiales bacterium]